MLGKKISSYCISILIFVFFIWSFFPHFARLSFSERENIIAKDRLFFPIGIFAVDLSALDEIKDSGFNTVYKYDSIANLQKYLEIAAEKGVKVILYSGHEKNVINSNLLQLKRDILDLTKYNPDAILCWYLIDEPALHHINPSILVKANNLIHSIDKLHPTLITVADPKYYKLYANVADIFVVDPYPIPRKPLVMIADYIEKAKEAVNNKRPIWVILQAFGYQNEQNKGWGWGREPTYDEMKAMTYLAIIHGARGIFYYTYHGSQYFIKDSPEHWEDLKRIVSELDQMYPLLLAPASHERIKLKIHNRLFKIDANGGPAIHFLMKELDGQKYLIAVNVINHEVTATVSSLRMDVDSLKVLFENREIPLRNGLFSDHFEPYEVHIYTDDEKFLQNLSPKRLYGLLETEG